MVLHSGGKRFAILLPGLYGGGAERTMLNLAKGIADAGHAVDLVLVQAEGPYMQHIPASLRVIDLGHGRILGRNRTLRRLPALVRYLRQEQPDAMLSALRRTNLVAVWARRMAGSPKRLLVNEQNHVSQEVSNLRTPVMRLWPYVARRFYPWADSVVGVSQGVVDDLVQNVGIPRELAQVVYNPVITPDLRERARAPLDHPWFGKEQPPVVLAVGRLTMQKDFPTLLEAFARLRRARDARLVILGEGEERRELEAVVRRLGLEADVSLPGFVENPYPYMRDASVFVLSSKWEGLPTVLIEAMYCGVPIVATDCPSGPLEILKNGELGCLVPMEDPAALAEAIATVLDGDGPRAADDSWRPYALENVVDQYVEALSATR